MAANDKNIVIAEATIRSSYANSDEATKRYIVETAGRAAFYIVSMDARPRESGTSLWNLNP